VLASGQVTGPRLASDSSESSLRRLASRTELSVEQPRSKYWSGRGVKFAWVAPSSDKHWRASGRGVNVAVERATVWRLLASGTMLPQPPSRAKTGRRSKIRRMWEYLQAMVNNVLGPAVTCS